MKQKKKMSENDDLNQRRFMTENVWPFIEIYVKKH